MNYNKSKSLTNFILRLTLMIGVTSMLTLSSCSKDDDKTPANQISDSEGLVISLEWSTGSTPEQAKSDVNLDLYVRVGVDGDVMAESSVSSNEFESLEFLGADHTDGDYNVQFLVWDEVPATWTLKVKGKSSTKVKTYTGNIVSGDLNSAKRPLTIKKSGNKYTITEV